MTGVQTCALPIYNEIHLPLNQITIDVHSNFEFSEAASLVKQLINQLPELQKNIMYLRDIEQLEYGEIAELTGLQINAIRVNLSRARKKVRDEYLKMNANENYRNKKSITKFL